VSAGFIAEWEKENESVLDEGQRAFVETVAEWGPRSTVWEDEPGRRFGRLALEGPRGEPRLVCYFRSDMRRPGLHMAFEWPLGLPEDALDFAVWLAHFMELLDEAGCELPRAPGPDGVARA
jgi:hypothetical protein